MPNSHCAEPNEIRHLGHDSNRRKARVPNAVEERDCDFVGDMTAAIFDAVWLVGMSVKGPRPAARQSPWSNANNAGCPERPTASPPCKSTKRNSLVRARLSSRA